MKVRQFNNREFIGGFHKRKVERWKIANQEVAEANKKAKRESWKEQRKEREEQLKEYDRYVAE